MKIQMTWKLSVKLAIIVGLIVVAVWAGASASDNEAVKGFVSSYGYIGILAVSVVSGFNVIVPIPVAALMPLFLEAGLSFWISVFIMTVGMTMGDSIGYLLGRTSEEAIVHDEKKNSKIAKKLDSLRSKNALWPYALLFFYASAAPAPNEIIVIPMGFLGYAYKKVFPIVFAGNFIFNTLFATGILRLSSLI